MIRESITKEQYKQIRTRLKYTQAEFATELGIDKQTVSRHETGERGISKTIAILIGYIFEKQKSERKTMNKICNQCGYKTQIAKLNTGKDKSCTICGAIQRIVLHTKHCILSIV